MKVNRVYLSLGSNIGNREGYLRDALEMLDRSEGIHMMKISSIYETDPVGYLEQAPFLNMVVEIETDLSPAELLEWTSFIENTLHRTREIHWGPRTLDIDILLFNEEIISLGNLHIPHPRMLERDFVLVPLREIAPDIQIPTKEGTFLPIPPCREQNKVRKWKPFLVKS